MRKLISSAVVALLVGGGLAVATALPANATPPAVCVPSDAIPAWTEVVPDITHPAVYETVVVTPAVEGTAAVWANFSPNDQHATFIGPPTYPTDERGTWHDHGQLPPGQAGEDGVYANGNPDKGGNWFYRQAAVPGTDAVTEQRLVSEERIEVVPDIEHPLVPAVTCPDDEEPPTTYTPTCTTVTDAQTITGDGVLTVAGGWATTKIAVPFTGTLADIGNVLDVTASQTQYLGLHIRTAQGSIAFEEEASYDGNLWSEAAWDGVSAGMGYAAFGSITDYIEFNGDVVVTGIDLLYTHPEASTTTVTSFTIGCTVYTFVPPVVVPEQPEPTTTVVTDEVVDCEAGTVAITTTTTTTTTVYDATSNTWVAGEPIVEVVETEREAAEEECPVVVVPEPEEPLPAGGDDGDLTLPPTTQALAQTGSDNAWIGWSLGGAAALLTGISLWLFGQARRTSGVVRTENAE